MRIKRFEEFSKDVYESFRDERYGYSEPEGKTEFSKWLRGLSQRMKNEVSDIKGEITPSYGGGFSSRYGGYGTGLGTADIYAQSKAAKEIFPGIVSLLAAGGAAIADFFKSDKSGKAISKEDPKKSKDEILDDWEKNEIGNKKVTIGDAEDFYKSGVLKGREHFGSSFDPLSPKTKEEENFSDYLNSATKRYYDKTRLSK